MAQLELRLSGKKENDGTCQILVRFFQGSLFDVYGKSEVYINPKYFEYYINRSKTAANGVTVPDNLLKCTKEKGERCGYVLRKSGEINNTRRLHDDEWRSVEDSKKRIDELSGVIVASYKDAHKREVSSKWLANVIDRNNHPEKYIPKEKRTKINIIYPYIDRYIQQRQLSSGHIRVFYVLARSVSRFEGFIQATDKNRKTFMFDLDRITRDDIEEFADYLRNEKTLSDEYPTLFKKLLEYDSIKKYYGEEMPSWVTKHKYVIMDRGENTVIKMLTRLKSVCKFVLECGKTQNRPFEGLKIGTEKVGTPYYISVEERNQIAETDIQAKWEQMSREEQQAVRMPLHTLIAQRDIFVFHCLIGCRVGDLMKMTSEYIEGGMLVYTPHKTKNEGQQSVQARVPLHSKAIELIRKYQGVDKQGRLFPFISPQRYNDAIKVIFTMAGVTRNVEVRNSKTGEIEIKPINEIATSHLARRTFIGGLYFRVADPNIIGKMSGHVEGSKAFVRYRNIEDKQLQDIINLIG